MKLNQLLLLGVTSFLTSVISLSGSSAGVLANSSFNSISPTSTSTSTKVDLAQNQTVALKSGTFVAGEKSTTGMARIVTENGHRYLEIDEAFSTSDQGPDLHVLLDTTEKPPQMYKNSGSYVNLGRLQKFSGAQRYPIPDAINPVSFKSIVIWCRMANATFGYATLSRTGNASSR